MSSRKIVVCGLVAHPLVLYYLWCNRTGLCKRCACVKAGKHCTNCLPSKLGSCTNNTPCVQAPMSSVPVTTPDDPATIALDTSQPLQDSPSPPNSMNQLTSNDLPCPEPASTSVFVWGLHVANDFSAILEATFAEVIHWRRNCFTVPLGKAGKEFVAELSKLYLAFASTSDFCFEDIT